MQRRPSIGYVVKFLATLHNSRVFTLQTSLKDQLSQRYRNNRRRTPATVSHKIVLSSACGDSTNSVLPSSKHEIEEYDENVEALKKLLKLKSPAAQTIQDLLKATREVRLKWLSSTPVSIHDIYKKYPVLAQPKWVSTHNIRV